MAKKNSSVKKSTSEVMDVEAEVYPETKDARESTASATHEEDTPPAKGKTKAVEEQSSNSNVGIGDIRKAVAFSNSVGGLDKAIAILQILKVAKEVQ